MREVFFDRHEEGENEGYGAKMQRVDKRVNSNFVPF
jgi:hypothetical protein